MNVRLRELQTFLFLLIVALPAMAQKPLNPQTDEFPKDYFRSPLDIPLNLSGNFGELRTNHFHAGLDIKTEQREGLPVFAVAEGYVSRIKVSPFGYGYALYITHPNGYTSVYGHLQRYAPFIDKYTRREQYKQKTFSIDLFPQPGDLPVSKGDLIGLSGNSGGSGGPHLHFEIRETESEKVVNPMLFGFKLADHIPPSIHSIWIIPMNDSAEVNRAHLPVALVTKKASGNATLASAKAPVVYGDIAFAVQTSDALDGNGNRCGIYRIELYIDSVQIYGQRMDRLDFTTNRAMNAHTIYEHFKKNKSQLHGSYRLPGNPLDIYDNLVNDGIIRLSDGKMHRGVYKIIDFEGNTTTLRFNIQASAKAGLPMPKPKEYLAYWDWEKENRYENESVRIVVPAYSLYEDLYFTLKKGNMIKGGYGGSFQIASAYEPMHAGFDVSLDASAVPQRLRDKAVVVRYDQDKGRIISEGGTMNDRWISAHSAYFGWFSILADTIPPVVSALDFASDMRGRSAFSFRISDGLSGIDQIIPTIDGNWALMEYDAKSSRLTYYFDSERLQHGRHQFELRILDERKNETVISKSFDW